LLLIKKSGCHYTIKSTYSFCCNISGEIPKTASETPKIPKRIAGLVMAGITLTQQEIVVYEPGTYNEKSFVERFVEKLLDTKKK
jgi:hypothetical protein